MTPDLMLLWGVLPMTANKNYKKIPADQLQEFLAFRNRHATTRPKKGKGSYNRNSFKKGQ